MSRVVSDPGTPADEFSGAQAGPGADGGDDAVSLREALAILRRHWLMVGAIAAVVTLLTGYVVYNSPAQYRAAALLRLTDAQREMTGGLGDDFMQKQLGRTTDPLLSQLEVLKGRQVLGEVVDREGLRLEPAIRGVTRAVLDSVQIRVPAGSGDSLEVELGARGPVLRVPGHAPVRGAYDTPLTAGPVTAVVRRVPGLERASFVVQPREDAIDHLTSRLGAVPRDKTDAVEINFVADDPQTAQRVVNTALTVFEAANARAAQDQSRRRRIFLEGQLRGTDSLLTASQLELSEFQRREEVYSSQAKFSAQQEGLLAVQVKHDSLMSARQMYASLMQGLSGAPAVRERALRTLASSPGLAANPVVAQLYTELIQHERSLDSLTVGSLGSTRANPDVQRLSGLVSSTQGRLVDAFRSYLAAMDAQIAGLGRLQERSAGELRSTPPTAAEEVRLVQRVESIRRAGDQLRDELEKARVAEAVVSGQVQIVYPAPLPRRPIGSGRGIKLGLGLMMGLLLGGLAAFFREHMNRSIVRKEDMDRLGVPSLGVVPRLEPGRGRKLPVPIRISGAQQPAVPAPAGVELVMLSAPNSPAAEAYRAVRTNLIFSHAVRELKTLVVTSSAPAEGKTLTSCNLAASFAQQGLRVLLVDCDLRKSRVHRVFGLPREPGLTEVVLGYATEAQAIHETTVEGLSVLASGTSPPNPSELLGGTRMRALIASLRERFDLVIFDTPPTLAAADAAVLGAVVDGAVMVVRAGQTELAAAQDALHQLLSVGTRVVGCMLNDPDGKVARYGGYYYSYGYYAETA